MKQLHFILVLFCFFSVLWALPPQPMESLIKYNVVLVHGAADSSSGFIDKCRNNVRDAYSWFEWKKYYETTKDSSWKLGGAPGMLGGPHERDDDLITSWLDSAIFEDYVYKNGTPFVTDSFASSVIYIQRSFANPAESPAHNAIEIGDRTWKGPNGCSSRRSLFEEAQEIRASGQDSLRDRRADSVKYSYRTIPSRNILIAHSMGGVASREYVQGDFYNHDVDKVITLDSPHEGTGALAMLIDLLDPRFTSGSFGMVEMVSQLATWYTVALVSKQNVFASVVAPLTFLSNWVELLLKGITQSSLNYGYQYTDPLVKYINPDLDLLDDVFDPYEPGIEILRKKTKTDSLPMFRLLYAENALTFTDPGKGWYNSLDFVVPDGLTAGIGNLVSQWASSVPARLKIGNMLLSTLLGSFAGVTMQNTGSSLISTESGKASNTTVLNSPNVNVEKIGINAALNAESSSPEVVTDVVLLTAAGLSILDVALAWNAPACMAAKLGVTLVSASIIAATAYPLVIETVADFTDSHKSPVMHKYQSKWYVDSITYSNVNGTSSSVKPLLMEDFLYERPFVNLALSLSDSALRSVDSGCYYEVDDANKLQLCEAGLYGSRDSVVIDPVTTKETHVYNAAVAKTDSAGNVVHDSSGNVVYDSVYYGTFEQRKYSDFRNSPLKFKSESDWYKVGVKVDRWERVDGLHPNGDPAPKGVPIRHVERYSVPDIVVDGFIEKYSFVVDDLMPHRMRQIKMTFNSNEEVAWECNIKAAEDDPHACAVYKRLLGNSWGDPDTTIGDKGYVAHPIKKNGRFDFNARKYFGNLANIQKDNQNTVMISMVNKIGLSNTQRFYYLFKATANMLKPTWPLHDVVLNAIDGFGVYVSALDYQGFRVRSAKDGIFSDPLGTPTQVGDSLPMVMTEFQGTNAEGKDTSSAVFASKQKISAPAEGAYRWVVDAVVNNNARDSSKTNSSMFITRFKWAGKDSADRANGSDIRAMLA